MVTPPSCSRSTTSQLKVETAWPLMVSGARHAHLWVLDGQRRLLTVIEPRPSDFEVIRTAWNSFATFLISDTPPPLTERDTR